MILHRGRLFGLVNIVDGAMTLGVCAALALAVLTYRSMTIPAPRVDGLVPNVITDSATPVQIRGAFLRPFVRVFLADAGRPLTMSSVDPAMRAPAPLEAKPKFVGPAMIELELPTLPSGKYDVYLFDDDHQIARLASALTVARVDYPRAAVEVLARFFTYDDAIEAMTGSDKGKPRGTAAAAADGARVLSIRRGAEVEEVQMRLAKYPGQEPFFFMGNRRPRRTIDVRLDVPAVLTAPDRWEYRGRPLRAGEPMTLDMPMHFEGEIVWVGEPRRQP
jgi:hypothetical protein